MAAWPGCKAGVIQLDLPLPHEQALNLDFEYGIVFLLILFKDVDNLNCFYWGWPSRLPVMALVAVLLPSLRGGQLPTAPAQPPLQETTPVEIIDISDDDEEIYWDLLRRESDEEEQASAEKPASLVGSPPPVSIVPQSPPLPLRRPPPYPLCAAALGAPPPLSPMHHLGLPTRRPTSLSSTCCPILPTHRPASSSPMRRPSHLIPDAPWPPHAPPPSLSPSSPPAPPSTAAA
ncbi:proline-rich receptor-like protein kinase PERK9 [Phragmites australis]|uniref:proline-rich receptor-like protein kinase PERK9 n=1 Tax=Phragmites australis TaxID=29695 RepID=UPI002D77C9BA|nr:proline-rich receptor-like protein kinase PERK9 [Phragmites australis]